jgi:hypothetical protein
MVPGICRGRGVGYCGEISVDKDTRGMLGLKSRKRRMCVGETRYTSYLVPLVGNIVFNAYGGVFQVLYIQTNARCSTSPKARGFYKPCRLVVKHRPS